MAGAWRALLLMAGVAIMACVAQLQSYEEIVNQALRIFNQGRRGRPLFRLLEVDDRVPEPNPATMRTLLTFRVKETVCISGQRRRQLQECDFREGGEERTCDAVVFTLQRFQARVLTVDCLPDRRREPEPIREKRSAASAGAPPPDLGSSKLPPVVRDMYEKAKYDIITNILRNF